MFTGGHRWKCLNYDVFMSLNIVFILANNADADEMLPYTAFHLDLQLAKVPGIKNENT